MADTYNIEQNDGITKVTMYVSREELDNYPGINPNIQFENYINDKGAAVFEWGGVAQIPQYKGWLTISEPSMIGREYDKQQRLLWRVTGNFEIYEQEVRTGGDVAIKVFLDDTWHEFENTTNITFNADRNANANQESTELGTKLTASVKGNSVAFSVDDVGDSDIMEWLRSLSDINDDKVSEATKKHRQRKVKVATYRKGELRRKFWAVPTATYNAASVSSIGTFSVVLSDDGMEE